MRHTHPRVFEDILYAQCWEDPEIDRTALEIGPSDTVFSITSGGCNTLAFLIDDPKKIYALDLNPCQNYLLDFKMAAFAGLSHEGMLELLGVTPSARRPELYRSIRPYLRHASRVYWDGETGKITMGVIHAGRYERYMGLLRTGLRILRRRELIETLFAARGEEARRELFRTRWDTRAWKLFTRILLSRRMMSALFTDQFFRYVEGSFAFGDHFAQRVRGVLTSPSLQENPFAAYILLGAYRGPGLLPVYLRPENFDVIRRRTDRVEMVTGRCEDFFSGCRDSSIQKFNFSNIFEWMSPDAYGSLLREAYRVGSAGAVLTYRNLLVFRERPAGLATLFDPSREFARKLLEKDRAFIYRNYVVETSRKEGTRWSTRSVASRTGTA
jgi:S-adenosylmethionine-diacylglycerol 3-amino-3-carboxypropyl transferase